MAPTEMLKKAPVYRFLVFIIMVLCWAQIYMGMQMIASYGAPIMRDLGINNSMLALISNGVAIALAIMCVAAGSIAIKLGGKKTIVLGCLIQAVAGAMFLSNPRSVAVLVIIRLIEGIGGGLINAFALGLIYAWFPKNERGFASGIQMGLYGVAISATTIISNAFNHMGLTWTNGCGYFIMGCGLVGAILVGFLYVDIEKRHGVSIIDDVIERKDEPAVGGTAGVVQVAPTGKLPATYGEMFRSATFWLLAIPIAGNTAASYNLPYCFSAIFPKYGYSSAEIVAILSVAFLGTIISCPLGGIISDRLFGGRRSETVAISYGLGTIFLIMFCIMLTGHASASAMTVICILSYAACMMSCGPIWALPSEIFAPQFFIRGLGVMLFITNVAGLLNITVSGMLADRMGSYLPGVIFTIFFIAISLICSIILFKKYRV
jgi:MFS family permease